MLKINGICKDFRNKKVLENIDLDTSESVAIVGKSGSGKTTLLNIVAGLISPDRGELSFNHEKLNFCSQNARSKFRQKHVGLIPQRFCIMNEYSVFDNIAYPLRLRRLGNKQFVCDAVNDIAVRLGIEDLLGEKAKMLSSGQCQRVAIARGLITSPALLLADEPTSALDKSTKDVILKELSNFQGIILIATHDVEIISSCKTILSVDL